MVKKKKNKGGGMRSRFYTLFFFFESYKAFGINITNALREYVKKVTRDKHDPLFSAVI